MSRGRRGPPSRGAAGGVALCSGARGTVLSAASPSPAGDRRTGSSPLGRSRPRARPNKAAAPNAPAAAAASPSPPRSERRSPSCAGGVIGAGSEGARRGSTGLAGGGAPRSKKERIRSAGASGELAAFCSGALPAMSSAARGARSSGLRAKGKGSRSAGASGELAAFCSGAPPAMSSAARGAQAADSARRARLALGGRVRRLGGLLLRPAGNVLGDTRSVKGTCAPVTGHPAWQWGSVCASAGGTSSPSGARRRAPETATRRPVTQWRWLRWQASRRRAQRLQALSSSPSASRPRRRNLPTRPPRPDLASGSAFSSPGAPPPTPASGGAQAAGHRAIRAVPRPRLRVARTACAPGCQGRSARAEAIRQLVAGLAVSRAAHRPNARNGRRAASAPAMSARQGCVSGGQRAAGPLGPFASGLIRRARDPWPAHVRQRSPRGLARRLIRRRAPGWSSLIQYSRKRGTSLTTWRAGRLGDLVTGHHAPPRDARRGARRSVGGGGCFARTPATGRGAAPWGRVSTICTRCQGRSLSAGTQRLNARRLEHGARFALARALLRTQAHGVESQRRSRP